jgi:hypothetical protein
MSTRSTSASARAERNGPTIQRQQEEKERKAQNKMLNSLSAQTLLKGMQPLEPFRETDDQDIISWLTDLEELFDAAKQKPEERLVIVPTYYRVPKVRATRIQGCS